MDVFGLRNKLVDDYSNYVKSFINIADDNIKQKVDAGTFETVTGRIH
ncbi:MAG: hypothetical protein R3A46_12625 [Thermomicrobiales bacterium]